MRIDLGGDGKIIGTRRVSPNGQVSGLSDYAGREVLVILPGAGEPSPFPNVPTPEDVTQMVGNQIRAAYDRYRALQELYATPWEATRSFLQSAFGTEVPDLMAQVDRWVKSQVQDATGGRSSQPTGPSETKDNPTPARGASSAPKRASSAGRKRP
jgi:hypothetical protein